MKRMSLRTKVLLAMIPMIAGMVMISFFAVHDIGEVSTSLDRMLNLYGKRNQLGSDAIRSMNNAENLQRLLTNSPPEKQQRTIKELDEQIDGTVSIVDDYLAMAGDYAKANLPKAKEKIKEWIEVDQQVRQLVLAGKSAEARNLIFDKSDKIADQFQAILDGCYEASHSKMMAEAEKGIETYNRSKWSLWLLTAIASAMGLVLIGFIIANVNKMMAGVDRNIHELEENSRALGHAAHDMTDSSTRLASGASQQAASLEETAASIEQISAMVNKNAENATKSQEGSNRSRDVAMQGQQVVEEMTHAIQDINHANTEIMGQIETSNREISEIVKVIAEIGSKTKVINDIVFQTRLLSFNASVEAARAGEHGKGFAVVAEEVGNLAEMSGNAAKEISAMLDGSIGKVESIVSQTKSSVERLVRTGKEKVDTGVAIAKRCGEVLSQVVQNVTEANQGISEISSASREQAQGVQEINKAIAQLDQVTQANALGAQQSADTAQKVSVQA